MSDLRYFNIERDSPWLTGKARSGWYRRNDAACTNHDDQWERVELNCPKCKEPIGEDGEWPVEVDEEINPHCCHSCFEAECDESWWNAVQQLSAAGLLEVRE